MSAWVVDREHIDVLIRFGLSRSAAQSTLSWCVNPDAENWQDREYRKLDFETVDEVGRMLWLENVRSVAYRYPDTSSGDRPGPNDFTDTEAWEYVYRDPGYLMTPQETLKAVGCLHYQSCECDDYEATEARRCLEAIEHAAVGMLYDGPWGWDREELSKRRVPVPR